MGKPSIFIKKLIIEKRTKNYSIMDIQRHLLKKNFSLTKKSISRICKAFFDSGRLADLGRCGRKSILKKIHLKYFEEAICNDRDITVTKLKSDFFNEFNFHISKQTISRAARKMKWIKKSTR